MPSAAITIKNADYLIQRNPDVGKQALVKNKHFLFFSQFVFVSLKISTPPEYPPPPISLPPIPPPPPPGKKNEKKEQLLTNQEVAEHFLFGVTISNGGHQRQQQSLHLNCK